MFSKTILSVFLLGSLSTFAQVGIGTTTPAAGSILDIDSSDKGLLIPRVALTATNNPAPITPAPVEGMMVYNTATGGTSPNIVQPGFYFWDGAVWNRVATGGAVTKDWTVTGNGDIDATTDFIGTTNAQALRFRTNDQAQFEISIDGRIRANNSGSQALPIYSFLENTNMGMYRAGNNDLRFATGGSARLQLTNSSIRSFQNHRFANGTAAVPSIAFQANTGTGFFRADPNVLGFTTDAIERMRIDATGNVGVNTSYPIYKLHLSNNGVDIGTTSLTGSINDGNNGVSLFGNNTNSLNNFNGIEGGTSYNLSTSLTAAIFGLAIANTGDGIGIRGNSNSWQGTGVLGSRVNSGGPNSGWGGFFIWDLGYTGGLYNPSDSRLKKNIQPINDATSILKKLNPVTYFYDIEKYSSLGFSEDLEYGLIAQEVKEILPTLVKEKSLFIKSKSGESQLNTIEDGISQNFLMIDYTRLTPLLIQAIKEQQEIIESQESRIERLEALVNQLVVKK